jgi:hypothetical protein
MVPFLRRESPLTRSLNFGVFAYFDNSEYTESLCFLVLRYALSQPCCEHPVSGDYQDWSKNHGCLGLNSSRAEYPVANHRKANKNVNFTVNG